jgi:hypothetical protein
VQSYHDFFVVVVAADNNDDSVDSGMHDYYNLIIFRVFNIFY